MSDNYRICTRCIMDTTDPLIEFDDNGFCNHCTAAIARLKKQILPPGERDAALTAMVNKIKHENKNHDYDCIIGVSGGVDSTYTAYKVKKLGLRPLAIHFDNGWDSELAVNNINQTLKVLGIDLYTHVMDWEEFKDLLISYLKASVVNVELPTDHGINAILFRMAKKVGTRFILTGSNIASESIMPYAWSHYNQDLKNLKAIHKRFGKVKMKTEPTISLSQYFYYVFVKRIRPIPFLNYIDFNKDEAKEFLKKELNWRDYGGKHYESVWTRFFQGYYLPTKFGYDKRRAHLSSVVCSEQMTREQALIEIEKPIYPEDLLRDDMQFVLKKFSFTQEEFDAIINAPNKWHYEYPSNYFLFHKLNKYKNIFRKIATTP